MYQVLICFSELLVVEKQKLWQKMYEKGKKLTIPKQASGVLVNYHLHPAVPPCISQKNPLRNQSSWKISPDCLVHTIKKIAGCSSHLIHEKNPLTFHHTGCLIGILIIANYNPHITGWYSARYIRNNAGFFIYVWSPSQVKCHSSSWVSSAWSQIHSWHQPTGPGATACRMMPIQTGCKWNSQVCMVYIGLVWFSKGAINIHQPMDGRHHQIIYFFDQI